jgi:uncharacterized protein (TIGR00288 family)
MAQETQSMALYCDFENVALGVRDAKYEKFDIKKVLERLLLKGSIVVKKAYCDWERYKGFKAPMHEASFELIEIPHVRQSGKNSADIRMVVDALDLCYTKSHVDTFVLITGDSDFSPLVSKLRENNKTVIGVGVKKSTSDLLIANCDEFIYYDDLVREKPKRTATRSRGTARTGGRDVAEPPAPTVSPESQATAPEAPATALETTAPEAQAVDAETQTPATKPAKAPRKSPARSRRGAKAAVEPVAEVALPAETTASAEADNDNAHDGSDNGQRSEEQKKQEAIDLVMETIEAMAAERGPEDKIWGSMVKQALKRRRPGFSENYYGFSSFSRLLDEAETRRLLTLEHDEKSGGVIIRAFSSDW